MRQLIERNVIFEYEHGRTDMQLPYIAYLREKEGKPPLKNVVLTTNHGYEFLEIEDGDIAGFIKQLSDEELLIAFDSQLCEKYR